MAAPAPTPPPAPTLTPEQLAIARQHFDAGTQAFQERRYEAALNEFTTAFEVSKEPDLLYNLHRVAIRLGQKDMAVDYLRQYLTYRPEETVKVQATIDKLNTEPLPTEPPQPAALVAVSPVPEVRTAAPRWPGTLLIVFGGASIVTGAALLGALAASSTDVAASQAANQAEQIRGRSLLGAGSFLLATGAVEAIGGPALYLKRRPKAQVALVPAGAGLKLAFQY